MDPSLPIKNVENPKECKFRHEYEAPKSRVSGTIDLNFETVITHKYSEKHNEQGTSPKVGGNGDDRMNAIIIY